MGIDKEVLFHLVNLLEVLDETTKHDEIIPASYAYIGMNSDIQLFNKVTSAAVQRGWLIATPETIKITKAGRAFSKIIQKKLANYEVN